MARRMKGLTYELVGVRDAGDGVMGVRDKIIVKDEFGRRHEFYLGDEKAELFLRELGLRLEDVEGLPFGMAQGKLSFIYHMMCARNLAQSGDAKAADEELRQAENGARMADGVLDASKHQQIEEVRSLVQTA